MRVLKQLKEKQAIVDRLEAAGFKVKLRHVPHMEHPMEKGQAVATGMTVVRILDHEGDEVGIGRAFCSENDVYNKRTGTEIALNRALKSLKDAFTREQRVALLAG